MTSHAAAVVPIRGFRTGKGRLAAALDDDARAELVRTMAARVLAAAAPLPVFVVTGDDDVAAFARDHGASVVGEDGRGLNAAARAGRAAVAAAGFERVVIAHADLANPSPFAWVADFAGVTIVPDRHGTGTNVLGLPASEPFDFAYGVGSRARHEHEAAERGLPLRVVDDPSLGWDVDDPADLT